MKRAAQLVLAAAAAAICVVAAVRFWKFEPFCPVLPAVLLETAVLGLAGLAAAIRGGPGAPPLWSRVVWGVCGGLVAVFFVGVWSIGPRVLLALLAMTGAALLAGKPWSRTTLANLGILVAVATLNFVLLFPLAKHSGVEVVEIPPGSLASSAFPVVDYADAYRARLPDNAPRDIESISRVVLAWVFLPCWTGERERAEVDALLQRSTFEPGTSPGDLKFFAKTPQEILIGADQSHLDFRVSILQSEQDGKRWVTVSTIVRYNNCRGRAYFIPVQVGHQIIMPHGVRTAAHNLH